MKQGHFQELLENVTLFLENPLWQHHRKHPLTSIHQMCQRQTFWTNCSFLTRQHCSSLNTVKIKNFELKLELICLKAMVLKIYKILEILLMYFWKVLEIAIGNNGSSLERTATKKLGVQLFIRQNETLLMFISIVFRQIMKY